MAALVPAEPVRSEHEQGVAQERSAQQVDDGGGVLAHPPVGRGRRVRLGAQVHHVEERLGERCRLLQGLPVVHGEPHGEGVGFGHCAPQRPLQAAASAGAVTSTYWAVL